MHRGQLHRVQDEPMHAPESASAIKGSSASVSG